MAPVFFYDFNSPYAYLAAARIDGVLGDAVEWQPVAFAFVLQAQQREPWSFQEPTRAPGKVECEQRADSYELPPLVWPPGWPIASYSLLPLRAAGVAEDHGVLREFSRAAFARNFVTGEGLSEVDDLIAVSREVGLDPDVVLAGATDPAVAAAALV